MSSNDGRTRCFARHVGVLDVQKALFRACHRAVLTPAPVHSDFGVVGHIAARDGHVRREGVVEGIQILAWRENCIQLRIESGSLTLMLVALPLTTQRSMVARALTIVTAAGPHSAKSSFDSVLECASA